MNVVDNWTIVKSPQYLRFNGIMIKTGYDQSLDGVAIDATVVNHLRCFVKLNPSTNPGKSSGCVSTLMGFPNDELRKKEIKFIEFIENIQKMTIHNETYLIIETNIAEQIELILTK
ncbi:hypothetical protein I4U23_010982 [Adineta vaga]|nr:hypothetical protein I4U23_010982 [Adineta vaga]